MVSSVEDRLVLRGANERRPSPLPLRDPGGQGPWGRGSAVAGLDGGQGQDTAVIGVEVLLVAPRPESRSCGLEGWQGERGCGPIRESPVCGPIRESPVCGHNNMQYVQQHEHLHSDVKRRAESQAGPVSEAEESGRPMSRREAA